MFLGSQRRKLLAVGASLGLVAGAMGVIAIPAAAAGTGPCDIYSSGGTPCVAAHSTVRALYGSYNGNLYQVKRASDGATTDIGVLSAGGYANAAAQDSFCSGTTCTIVQIYDQSGRGNHLTVAPAGGAGGADTPSNATAAQITIAGHKAYGVYIAAGNGYRRNSTSGIATGDAAEGMYAVFDGSHYNGGCCFDYGNAETNNNDNGNGHMEAIYFGNIKVWGYGTGNGPWVMADLENGLFSGVNAGYNSNDPTVNYRYLTAIIKGQPNNWAIRAGNAQSGGLSTYYNGARPNVSGYNPMHKEGAIILGIGGDNSKGAVGTFYEGAMTSSFPSDATENSVQANIVAAGYGSGTTPTPTPTATAQPSGTPVTGTVSINAGGSATGSFSADQYYSGGSTYTNSATIDMSQITSNPPPAAIFNTERYGAMTYTIPNRTGAQTVTLYFSENYVTAAGQRLFNVSINGSTVLSNFDIYASAGGSNRAIARTFSATANSSGQVVIQFISGTENPKISGISVTAGGTPTPTPTAAPTATAPPSGSNLLTNGDAESGTTGWSVFGSGTLASNTSVVHGGGRSLLITGRTSSWNGISQDVTSKLTNGRSYTTNVWMRTQSGTPTGKVTMAVTANGSTNYIQLAAGGVNSSGWTLLSGTATISWSGTLSSARFYVETTSGTDSFYIDDASFQ
jgi:hypothetical protein